MQNIITYNINEIIALVTAVLIGTGAYIGFMILKKKRDLSFAFVASVLIINLFVTHIFSEVLKATKMGEYRTIVLPAIAYLGQYLMEWVDKRYLKIFDAGAKKVGLNLDTTDIEEIPLEDEKENI